jgi:histidinol-phosphate aminotransferase
MPQCLKLAGAVLDEVPVKSDFSFDLDELERRMDGAKIAMFASPENPTGAVIPSAVIEQWCAKFPNTLFVVDEAYGEYWGQTVLSLIDKFDNLLVTRTFSKAWGMAGFRLGLVFGQPALIDMIKRIKLPYSVNSAAVLTAMRLLDQQDQVLATAKNTMDRKDALEGQLKAEGYSLVSGFANSFLLKLGAAESKAFEYLARSEGVLVRLREQQYVRVSIGTEAEMEKFRSVLKQFKTTLVAQQ